jgi:enamine deaminase RidA (YjgF/YER057c/UK114 family)
MGDVAVRSGELVFVGGVTGRADDIFPRLSGALAQQGAILADIVELTTFHADVRQIDECFAAGAKALSEPYPAWTPVGMAGPGAGDEPVVARAIAHTGDGERTTVIPDTIRWWRGRPWSAGCRRGSLLALAGQFGTDTDGNVVMPGHHDGQARNALNRLKEICSLVGADLADVVDVWSFHQDPRWIEACLEVAATEFFRPGLPTWAAAGAPALYRFGMLGQFRALAEIGEGRLTALALEAGTEVREAFDSIAVMPGELVEVVCFHKDIRDADDVRGVASEVLGDKDVAWTSAGMTGFQREESRHAIHALSARS